jgi:osmoprotectant transport system permease protein
VAEGRGVTGASFAVVSEFIDAIRFILFPRGSISGDIQVGGLAEFGQLTLNHLQLSVVALLAATAVAMPVALFLGHIGRGQVIAVSVSNVGRAVPILALLGFFVAYLGIGFVNVTFVLLLLAVPPILTNTYVGITQVEHDPVDAARGMGMSELQILTRVELPMALPTIFSGLRTSTVAVVATATIAPLANVQTLGTPIIEPQTYGQPGILAAAIVVAVITLASDAALKALQEAIVPKGLKLAASRSRSRRGPLSLLRGRPQPT